MKSIIRGFVILAFIATAAADNITLTVNSATDVVKSGGHDLIFPQGVSFSGAFGGTPASGTFDLGNATLKLKPSGTGAISRDAAAQINDIAVNVLTWGADNTGATDATVDVQKAIDVGKTVYFPKGTYKVASLKPHSTGQRFLGESRRDTVFTPVATGSNIFDLSTSPPADPVYGGGAYGYHFENFRVQGTQNGSTGSTGAAFFCDSGAFIGDDITWEKIDVQGMGYGWKLNGLGNCTFIACHASVNTYGFFYGSSTTAATGNGFNLFGLQCTQSFTFNIWIKSGTGWELSVGDTNYGGATSAYDSAGGIRIGDSANGLGAYVSIHGGNGEAQSHNSGVALQVESSSFVYHTNGSYRVGGAVTTPPVVVKSLGQYQMNQVSAGNATVSITPVQCEIGAIIYGDGALVAYGTDDGGGSVTTHTGWGYTVFDNGIPIPSASTDGQRVHVVPRNSVTTAERFLIGRNKNGTHTLGDVDNTELITNSQTISSDWTFNGTLINGSGGQFLMTNGQLGTPGGATGGAYFGNYCSGLSYVQQWKVSGSDIGGMTAAGTLILSTGYVYCPRQGNVNAGSFQTNDWTLYSPANNTFGLGVNGTQVMTSTDSLTTLALPVRLNSLTGSKSVLTDASKNLVSGTGPPAQLVASNLVLAASATTAAVTTYTTPNDATVHPFRVGVTADVTAVSAGTLTMTATFTDQNNSAQTVTFYGMGLTTAGLSATGYTAFPSATLWAKPNTAITVVATFAGASITYDAGGTIESLY